jgi:sterol 3beta-glucosyltransferase
MADARKRHCSPIFSTQWLAMIDGEMLLPLVSPMYGSGLIKTTKILRCEVISMLVTVIAIGTRGDVQPYLALSQGLIEAGYAVRLVTHAAFETLARDYAIPFFPLDDDMQEFLQPERARKVLDAGQNGLLFAYRLARFTDPLVNQYMQRCWEACQDADLIIVTFLSFLIGYSTAEKLSKALVATFLQPLLLPTKFLPEPGAPHLPQWPPLLGKMFNYQSHLFAGAVLWRLFTPTVNVARQNVYHLPPLPKKSLYASLPDYVDLILYAYSPLLVPKPPDWGEMIQVTGFWSLGPPKGWQPDPSLVEFLESGPPPVYVGFGSVSPHRPEETADIVKKALSLAKQRGVIMIERTQGSDQRLSDTLYVTNGLPHEWLFPYMQAVVHHGGAGTTAASLRAGVPTIIVPHVDDQQFWGERVAKLGVGPKPVARRHLSAHKLAELLNAVGRNQDMQRRAQEVGAALRKENGVGQAVKAIQACVASKKK